jgi:ribonuclease BN (tRNA processing enzyme)
MSKPAKRTALVLAVAALLVLGLASVALAAEWSDLPSSTLGKYGVNSEEVHAISQGFADGTFRPDQLVTRAQFTKMAVEAFAIAQASPATPSFTDVPADNPYYAYVEGAKAAGLVGGVTATEFAPDATMTHQQCFAIVMRWVAKATGVNTALAFQEPAVAAALAGFDDAGAVGADLADEVAMAVKYGVYQKGDWGATLNPSGAVTRIDAAAALVRGMKVDGDRIGILGLAAGPVMWTDRNNTGFLLFVNGAEYMIDCGPGTPNGIFRLGVSYGPLKNLFFTHYHFDHYGGYPDLLERAYQTRDSKGAALSSLDVWGPPGLKEITDGFLAGLDYGFKLHNWNPARPNLGVVPTVHEFNLAATGIEKVYEDANVVATSTRVYHDKDVPNAYAYRFDIKSGPNTGKSVVFSGDTVKNAQLIALAKDCTVLVHEVGENKLAGQISPPGTPLYNHLINSHTDVAEIPGIAKEANAGMVVLHHYGNVGSTYTLAEAADMILTDVLAANATVGYTGKIIAPLELDVIGF